MIKKINFGKLLFITYFITLVILASFIFIFVINVHIKSSTENKIISLDEAAKINVDCIMVLGAGVRSDGSPSPMLEDRILESINIYNNGVANKILMSGDHSTKGYDEVNTMKLYAVEMGIPSEQIFMDHAGFSTYDSIYRAKAIFQADKIIIVTQKYHLYRALYIANALGIDAYGVASDPRQYVGQNMREMREKIARIKDFIKVKFKPYPTYLGETIPVSGNGDVTNDK